MSVKLDGDAPATVAVDRNTDLAVRATAEKSFRLVSRYRNGRPERLEADLRGALALLRPHDFCRGIAHGSTSVERQNHEWQNNPLSFQEVNLGQPA
jgi:hypothetical protein